MYILSIHLVFFLLHLQLKERLNVSLFNQKALFHIFESTPNWPLGLWPLAAKLLLLNIARYHYTQIISVWLWHWAGDWHGTPVTHQCGGGGNESWGRSSGELTSEGQLGWERESHCHVFALTMPHYDWECHYRADTMSPPGSAAHKHSHLWQWAKQFISQNFTESMQSANDCVLKAFVTV